MQMIYLSSAFKIFGWFEKRAEKSTLKSFFEGVDLYLDFEINFNLFIKNLLLRSSRLTILKFILEPLQAP